MVKAIVTGVAGRMGGRIVHMMEAAPGIRLAGAVESPGHAAVGQDVGPVVGLPPKGIKVVDSLDQVLPDAAVVIEFTHPEPSLAHLHQVADAGKAMVLGTTGFSPPQIAEIHALASRAHLVFAPNMSIGVNLMFKVVADVARVLGDGFDVEIVEAHHRLKKDAPSGTAIKLGQVIAHALGRELEKTGVYARHGIIGQRTDARDRHPDGPGRGHRRRAHGIVRAVWASASRLSTGPTAGTISPGARSGRPSGSSPSPRASTTCRMCWG